MSLKINHKIYYNKKIQKINKIFSCKYIQNKHFLMFFLIVLEEIGCFYRRDPNRK